MDIQKTYQLWCDCAKEDHLSSELEKMSPIEIEDAFYRDLAFGTGGLRGIIGAGTNRMNVYTVAKASQGLADHLKKRYGNEASIAIGYDSRIKSELFAKTSAEVFAANGLKVHLWPRLLPVPVLSFAVRYLKTSAGIMITASHNPAAYNGYKVYGEDGCQITTRGAKSILDEIEKLDIFQDVVKIDFEKGLEDGQITFIPEEVLDRYIDAVKNQSVIYGESIDKAIDIVYSPLNGAGLEPVTRALDEMGYQKITIVEEQRRPDGNFPTCPYPNPEIKEALALGLEYCQQKRADLMLATDPDCDRVGIAVKDEAGAYELLSGNEVGLLLLDYLCCQREKHGTLPERPLFIKTIVTIDLAERIAAEYGLETINVLTGFKFIGEQIRFLEEKGEASRYVFGFEESYGYLSGTYVRDKDGVNAATLICEMFAYYTTRGITLPEKLKALYEKYGYCLNTLHSFQFEGSAGMVKMAEIMERFRKNIGTGDRFGGKTIIGVEDYNQGINALPKSDVIKYLLEDNCSVVIRPSGTEPKLKAYLSVSARSKVEAKSIEKLLHRNLKKIIDISKETIIA